MKKYLVGLTLEPKTPNAQDMVDIIRNMGKYMSEKMKEEPHCHAVPSETENLWIDKDGKR